MADVRSGDAVNTRGPSRSVFVVLLVEFLLIVGGLTTAIVLAAGTTPHTGLAAKIFFWQDKGTSDAGDRAEAVAVARQFILNVQEYPASNADGYNSYVLPMLTTKARAAVAKDLAPYQEAVSYVKAQCDKATGELAKECAAYQAKATVTIPFGALSSFDGSSATVLVPSSVVYIAGGDAQTFRSQVTLRKIDGHWLVDDYATK